MTDFLLVLGGVCVGVVVLGFIAVRMLPYINRTQDNDMKNLSPEARRGLKRLRGKSREEIRQILSTPVYDDQPARSRHKKKGRR